MSKNIKKIILLVFVLVLIFLAYFLIQLNDQEKNKNNPAAGQNSANQETENEAAANFEPEMMTEAEKLEMKIGPQLNIQVITRDENGKVNAYKIIRTQSDIVNLNQ